MAYSEAQKRATLKYRREKTKNITVTFYQFDYQSERHCSKTHEAVYRREDGFDYQSERHCSKTGQNP
jgi:hypothetical protein